MSTLNTYLKETYRLIRDPKFEMSNPKDMIEWVNIARREVVLKTQCVRVLTQSSGACQTATVTAGGSGYVTAPTVTISPPDFPSGVAPFPGGSQATATASIQSGTLSAVSIDYGGSGYYAPIATFTGGSGAGAAATINTSPVNAFTANQEVYPFSSVYLGDNPGAGAVYCVISISVIYANYRFSLPVYSFSEYQAKIRQYPFQYVYVPSFASQYGQGSSGSFYVYPIPSSNWQFELDCLCLPQDLITDLSVEIIPSPWDGAVKFYVAHLWYLSAQNFNAANMYLSLFDRFLLSYSVAARPGRAVNPYGRY